MIRTGARRSLISNRSVTLQNRNIGDSTMFTMERQHTTNRRGIEWDKSRMGVSSGRHGRLVFDSFLVVTHGPEPCMLTDTHTCTHTWSRAVYAHGYTHTHTHTRSRAVYAHGYTHTVGPVYVAGNTRIGRRGTQIARGAVPLTYSTIITHYRPIAGAGACALTSVANYTSSRKGGRGAGT